MSRQTIASPRLSRLVAAVVDALGTHDCAKVNHTSYDQRPVSRPSVVGHHLYSEWHIFAPHTKSLDDRGRAHLNTTWKAGCVNMPFESGVIGAKL